MEAKYLSSTLKTDPLVFTIYPCSHHFPDTSEFSKYLQEMSHILKKLIPERSFFEDSVDIKSWLQEQLPIVKWSENLSPPDCMNICLLCYPSKGVSTEVFFQNL